ncbi:glycosyltransferase family 25 protein [Sphingomonas sanguinis]|uniref:Glycosyltransferase family 25 protein n=1 Tax=Sphingomonas sanguinis TaxID=33051 RepID=A0ABU5LQF3_9SPHN|nr:glycosyltransferase family 25 protein [Sphingomonas sanguinis]MDZ7281950.1 glycosyltransferase family 25 protein [Sphingomonas sanguinis]
MHISDNDNPRVMVRVIALDENPRSSILKDRPKEIEDYKVYKAVRCVDHEIRYDNGLANIHKGRPLTVAELLCYSSHFCVWKDFIASESEILIVLEDDTVIDWKSIGVIIGSKDLMLFDGIFRLFTRYPAKHKIVGETKNRFITRLVGYACGAQGYILGRHQASKLVDYCRIASRPIDDQIDRYWDHGVRSFSVYPFPVMEMLLPSTVQHDVPTYAGDFSVQWLRRIIYTMRDGFLRTVMEMRLKLLTLLIGRGYI